MAIPTPNRVTQLRSVFMVNPMKQDNKAPARSGGPEILAILVDCRNYYQRS
jgi:hypothetical protein